MAATRFPLSGRALEVKKLRESAALARSGHRATVLVDGEAYLG